MHPGIQLGFCSNAYTRTSLEDSIRRIAQLGYAGVELLCDAPHYWPPQENRRERAAALTRQLRECNVAATNINANTATGFYGVPIPENAFGPSLASRDESLRRFRVEHVREALELAHAVGAPSVSVTSGYTEDDHPPAAALDVLERSLTELLPRADELGVNVGIEAEPGLLLECADDVRRFLQRVDHPRLGFNLDIGHCVVSGEDPCAVIHDNVSRIWHLHLEDIRGRTHYHLVPGEGDVDFTALFSTLVSSGYTGYASVEVYPYRNDPDAAATRAHAALMPLLTAAQSGTER